MRTAVPFLLALALVAATGCAVPYTIDVEATEVLNPDGENSLPVKVYFYQLNTDAAEKFVDPTNDLPLWRDPEGVLGDGLLVSIEEDILPGEQRRVIDLSKGEKELDGDCTHIGIYALYTEPPAEGSRAVTIAVAEMTEDVVVVFTENRIEVRGTPGTGSDGGGSGGDEAEASSGDSTDE